MNQQIDSALGGFEESDATSRATVGGGVNADLAEKAGLSLASIQRMERDEGVAHASAKNVEAVRKTLDEAGIEFIPENGGGLGVRFKARKNG